MSRLIVYACPTGALAEQLRDYLAASERRFGPNEAHRYPPHCTLTGFFHDEPESIGVYQEALEAALWRLGPERPEPPVTITDPKLENGFHRLVLESPWLLRLSDEFADLAWPVGRAGRPRLEKNPHLSLAYYHPICPFPKPMHEDLGKLAKATLELSQQVAWELRLYERRDGDKWHTHGAWPLDARPSP